MPNQALNPDAVLIGTAGGPGIWIAPVGTAAPADASTAPAAAWTALGYLSEDGVTLSQSTDSESITPWQSRSPVRTIITGRELTAEFTMIEFQPETVALYFGQEESKATIAADGFSMDVRSDAPAINYALMIDVKDGTHLVRYFFPRATLSDAGDMEITASGVIGLPVTMTALDDNGVLAKVIAAAVTVPARKVPTP